MSNRSIPQSELPQYPQSYWLASTDLPDFPKLDHDLTVDVAVVGAGISGITTAYLLTKQGLKVALIEAGEIMNGTTGHTTAKITAQHDLIYNELISHIGVEQAGLYYEANHEALQFINQTVQEHQIECDFTEQDAHIYTSSVEYVEQIESEFKAYETLGIPGAYLDDTPLPFLTKAAVAMKHQAQFNPTLFLKHLVAHITKQGGQIFQHTTAETVEKGNPAKVITSDKHKITCDYVVSATHFPFFGAGGFYFARLFASRSYALGVKTEKPYPGGMYLSAEEPKRSLRSALIDGEQMVIIGGEGHKTGQGICTIRHYEALQKFGEETFGLRSIPYRWSAQDFFTLDRLPYIGHVTEDMPNVLVATGYKKWGMTTSVAAALLNVKLITGQGSPYEQLFSPARFHADPSIKTFIRENTDVVRHYIAGKLETPDRKPEQLEKDEGGAVTVNGKRAGAYRDPQGQLHVLDTTCTHMGCEVEWNEAERTWDCPCHGSRFSYHGEVMEGPAKKPLGKLKNS